MHARNASLPPLDLLRSFEAAARHLSFTKAAEELFLTQSAVSRQIQQVESHLGTPLFERRHRSLALTEAGLVMQRAVVDCLERLRDATSRVRAQSSVRRVAITSTAGFASLWLIPRLAGFTDAHPNVDVRISATSDILDLAKHQIDIAVRFIPVNDGVGPPLFEEVLQPVCSPRLVADKRHPLRKPADLAQHTLLTVDMHGYAPTADWEPWLRVMGLGELRMKNTLRFTQYPDAVSAAVAGQGVVIGRLPLLAELLRDKRLVAPFSGGAVSRRGYYIVMSDAGAANPDAQAFAEWLRNEAEAARQLL
jgi:DNA-binding transcriptional LysR family regulator